MHPALLISKRNPDVSKHRAENEKEERRTCISLWNQEHQPPCLQGVRLGYLRPWRSSTSKYRQYQWIRAQERPQQHLRSEIPTLPAIRNERASIAPSNPVALSREPHQPLPPALPLALDSFFEGWQVARPPPQRPRSGFGPQCLVGRVKNVLLGSTCLLTTW
jgi:hypothetical protein